MDGPRHTDREIDRTEQVGQFVYGTTWVGAAIGMAANAGNAVVTFGTLGGNRAVGLAIGVFVDVALIAALIGDRQLAKHGMRSGWSWAVQGYAAVFGLAIAITSAVVTSNYVLALLLAGVLPLLWLLMGYGQDVSIKFARLIDRLRRTTETVPVVVPTEPARAPVFEPFPTVRIDPVSHNGHNNDDGGTGWQFVPPSWVNPEPAPEPDVVTEQPADEGGVEVGLDDDPRTEPVDDPVEVPEPGPRDPAGEPIGDGLPSLEAVREWRATQRDAGQPYGRDALRERFGLSEREARAVVAAVKRADAEQPLVVGS